MAAQHYPKTVKGPRLVAAIFFAAEPTTSLTSERFHSEPCTLPFLHFLSLKIHRLKAIALFDLVLHSIDSFFCLGQITRLDVAVELDRDGVLD